MMDLIEDIRRKREEQSRKQPLKRDVFNQVSCIVKQYGLRENFLDILDRVQNYLPKDKVKSTRVRMKTPLENPLFSLVTKDQYALTMSIINRIDNSYLKYAHSPEELLLSGPLYKLNPSLEPEDLKRYHFETLFLHVRTKANSKEPYDSQ